jgi:hypothetical protein
MFGQNTLAYYAGDLTPKDAKPCLSDYLTIKHTIDALEVAFSDRSREDIVSNDSLLVYYFPEKVFNTVRESESERHKMQSHAYMTFEDGPTFDDV